VEVLTADLLAKQLRDEDEDFKKELKRILGSDVYDTVTDKSIPEKINAAMFGENVDRLRKDRAEMLFNVEVNKSVQSTIKDASARSTDVLILDWFAIYSYLHDTFRQKLINKVFFVSCEPAMQIQRLKERRNVDEALSSQRINRQHSLAIQEKKMADSVIDNSVDDDDENLLLQLKQLCISHRLIPQMEKNRNDTQENRKERKRKERKGKERKERERKERKGKEREKRDGQLYCGVTKESTFNNSFP